MLDKWSTLAFCSMKHILRCDWRFEVITSMLCCTLYSNLAHLLRNSANLIMYLRVSCNCSCAVPGQSGISTTLTLMSIRSVLPWYTDSLFPHYTQNKTAYTCKRATLERLIDKAKFFHVLRKPDELGTNCSVACVDKAGGGVCCGHVQMLAHSWRVPNVDMEYTLVTNFVSW